MSCDYCPVCGGPMTEAGQLCPGCGVYAPGHLEPREALEKTARTTGRPAATAGTTAAKDHQGKARLDLVPPELLFGVGEALADGCRERYEPRNWEKGTKWSKYFAAQQRHMWAWWGGEDNDPESGLPHLWHAACCTAFLVAYAKRGVGVDDRPKEHSHD